MHPVLLCLAHTAADPSHDPAVGMSTARGPAAAATAGWPTSLAAAAAATAAAHTVLPAWQSALLLFACLTMLPAELLLNLLPFAPQCYWMPSLLTCLYTSTPRARLVTFQTTPVLPWYHLKAIPCSRRKHMFETAHQRSLAAILRRIQRKELCLYKRPNTPFAGRRSS